MVNGAGANLLCGALNRDAEWMLENPELIPLVT